MDAARVVITDSGGLQEETTYLGVPCLTLRPNTERPITIEQGTNRLVPRSRPELLAAVLQAIGEPRRGPAQIDLWDGAAAGRTADAIAARARPVSP